MLSIRSPFHYFITNYNWSHHLRLGWRCLCAAASAAAIAVASASFESLLSANAIFQKQRAKSATLLLKTCRSARGFYYWSKIQVASTSKALSCLLPVFPPAFPFEIFTSSHHSTLSRSSEWTFLWLSPLLAFSHNADHANDLMHRSKQVTVQSFFQPLVNFFFFCFHSKILVWIYFAVPLTDGISKGLIVL